MKTSFKFFKSSISTNLSSKFNIVQFSSRFTPVQLIYFVG